MTISSQCLTGDELTRFLDMLATVAGTPQESAVNIELSKIVRAAISKQSQQVRNKIKSDIADEIKKKFPDITGM